MNPWPGRATLAPAELASAMGVHPRTVRRWIKAGVLRAVLVNRRQLIPIDEALRITGNAEAAVQATITELVRPPAPPPSSPVNWRSLTPRQRAVRHW